MKRNAPAVLGLIGFSLMAALLAFLFTQHGTAGLYHVNGQYRTILSLAGGAALLLLVLSAAYLALSSRLKGLVRGLLTTALLIGSVIGIIVSPAALAYTQGALSGSIGDTPPQLLIADGAGANGIPNLAVAYNTSIASADGLRWGIAPKFPLLAVNRSNAEGSTSITEDEPTKEHVFMLTDLKPATDYFYFVNEGPTYSFTTPGMDGTLRFAVASDAHIGAVDNRIDRTQAMLNQINRNYYDYFFSLGDLVEYGFSQSQWGEAFNTFSRATSWLPVRYAIGNHDSLFGGFQNYLRYAYPAGMDTQTGSRLWYRIDVGKIHFLVLDVEWSAEAFTKAQADWLEAQLKDIPAGDWKIVMSHGFYYASGSRTEGWNWFDNPETIKALTPLFEQYKVDLVFSGHNHQMELLQKNGVTYAICGAFGGLPDQPRTYTSPASLWYLNGTYGFADISISGNRCDISFRDSSNAVLKTFTITK